MNEFLFFLTFFENYFFCFSSVFFEILEYNVSVAYNIQFQIAGFIVIFLLTVIFFSKKRWKSVQNTIYRVLLFVTLFELAFDIVSVITICNRNKFPRLNEFFSVGYIVLMISYIYTVDLYTVSNTFYAGMTKIRRKVKFAEIGVITLAFLASLVVILSNDVLYGGEAPFIYSYGIPSDTVYKFSTVSVIFVVIMLLVNVRHIPVRRQLSIYSFCIMEGIVALVQMYNKQLLIVGFGSAIAVMLMYFTLENPDMKIIAQLDAANRRSRELLLNILPVEIADRLTEEPSTFTQKFDDVTIMFLDIVDFSGLSNRIGAVKTVKLLNTLFSRIDDLLCGYSIEKIKTIGDSYMTAAGVPEPYADNCKETVDFAKDILRTLEAFNQEFETDLKIRIGINCGSVVAGIIGKRKFIYDLWGASVNLASRMESYGEANRIDVSPLVMEKLKDNPNYTFEPRPELEIKGFGRVQTYFVS